MSKARARLWLHYQIEYCWSYAIANNRDRTVTHNIARPPRLITQIYLITAVNFVRVYSYMNNKENNSQACNPYDTLQFHVTLPGLYI